MTVPLRLAARTGSEIVFLPLDGLLAFEARDRLTYAHHERGAFLIDLSLRAVELAWRDRLLRVHRSWLVVPARVEQLGRVDGDLVLTLGELRVPVARERAKEVRSALLRDTIGLTKAQLLEPRHSSPSNHVKSSTASASLSNAS